MTLWGIHSRISTTRGPLLRALLVVLRVGALAGPSLLTESLVAAMHRQRQPQQVRLIRSLIVNPRHELAANDGLPTCPISMT